MVLLLQEKNSGSKDNSSLADWKIAFVGDGKMKKKNLLIVAIALGLLTLSGCRNEPGKTLSKEGIAPYELSDEEKYILDSFGMTGTSQMISFHAPEEAITLETNVYCLDSDGTWKNIGGGAMSIGEEREPVEQLIGNMTMQLREDYSIDFNINSAGRYSFASDPITPEREILASSRDFLQEFQKIELDKEIPVALMVYDDGQSMRTHSLNDYFEPERFEGMDLVQVVTLKFSGEGIR